MLVNIFQHNSEVGEHKQASRGGEGKGREGLWKTTCDEKNDNNDKL